MRAMLSRRKQPDLEERIDAVRELVDVGRDRLSAADVDRARAVLQRASERLGMGAEHTVVALAGATGSGKSSLFNALSGTELSQAGVRRPTTGTAHACVWGEGDATRLLDWLGVPRRHHLHEPELEGLVLLDLPDHDSTESAHRLEVDRLAELVDVFVWVVDPQKYADAALHEGYLRPLAGHAAVTLLVLNQIDRLSEDERRACVADIDKLLSQDGLEKVRVVSSSARTGEGVAELREVIAARVAEERAAAERLNADLDQVVLQLEPACGEPTSTSGASKQQHRQLVEALARAAQVDRVTEAVGKTHRRDAGLVTGWPLTRWLRRLRPDPLSRLHLGRSSSGGRTSLPAASPVQQAQAETAVRHVTSDVSKGLPSPWPDLVRERAMGSSELLMEDLDRAVSRTDLGAADRPKWWTLAGGLQTILAAVAAIGFLWLTVLFALQWLGIPRPPTPKVEEIPWPTILLLGGLLAGFLLAFIFGQFARVGAARRRRRARDRLVAEVEQVAKERVLGPVEEELRAYTAFCAALSRARR